MAPPRPAPADDGGEIAGGAAAGAAAGPPAPSRPFAPLAAESAEARARINPIVTLEMGASLA